jgi:hypothetical protein
MSAPTAPHAAAHTPQEERTGTVPPYVVKGTLKRTMGFSGRPWMVEQLA